MENTANSSTNESARDCELGLECLDRAPGAPQSESDTTSTCTAIDLKPDKYNEEFVEDASSLDGEASSSRSAQVFANKDTSWILKHHGDHVFILSEAGKPIFSRHGSEEELSPVMGFLQALSSVVSAATPGDHLISIRSSIFSDGPSVAFLHRSPLLLVGIGTSTLGHLAKQLQYSYDEILSVLTKSQLIRVFQNRWNYDLRRLLTGSDRTLRKLQFLVDSDAGPSLNAIRPMPISTPLREGMQQAMLQIFSKQSQLVLAVIECNGRVLTFARNRKCSISPSDMYLLLALMMANPSATLGETWTPVCLPNFEDSGFLHAHISSLNEDSGLNLILLTTDRTAFFAMSELRSKLLEKFAKLKLLDSLSQLPKSQPLQLSEIPGISELWHFIYKNRTSGQLCCAKPSPPLTDEELNCLYREVIQRLGSKKVLYYNQSNCNVLVWQNINFTILAVFSPFVAVQTAVKSLERLIKWLQKEEARLFILNPPVF